MSTCLSLNCIYEIEKHQAEFTEIINTLYCCTKSICLVNYRCFLKISIVEIFIWRAVTILASTVTMKEKTCACTRHALQTSSSKKAGRACL